MAATVKFGSPIFEEQTRQKLENLNVDDVMVSLEDINKEMAKEAMRKININKLEALERVNGMKKDYGNGVSTRIMVYNGLGVPLQKRSSHDDSGRWSTNTLADRIEVGEWSIGFHHKKAGSATGSCGAVGYNLLGYGNDDVLMIGWDTPWSGSNSAYCAVMTTSKWSRTSWDDIIEWAEDGPKANKIKFGRSLTKFDTDSESSATLTVVATRSDIGQ